MQYTKPPNPLVNQMRQMYSAPQAQVPSYSYEPSSGSHPPPTYNPGKHLYPAPPAPSAPSAPQAQASIQTQKPFILFIKAPSTTKTGIPDGCAHVAYIYNATPKSVRQYIHVHFLDKQPVNYPGLTGYPQLYDRTKNVFIPYGTKTILSLLHMVRNMGVDIHMADLHASSARFDMDVARVQQQISKKKPSDNQVQGQFKAPELRNWKLKVEQNEQNPYDPSLKADEGVGGEFLDGAALSRHFDDCADVDLFETGAREDFGGSSYGSPVLEFNYQQIDDASTTTKLTEAEMSACANLREKHWNELKSRITNKTKAPVE